MRWFGFAAAAAAATLLTGCFTWPDCASAPGAAPVVAGAAERAALDATDAAIAAELAAARASGGFRPARLDAAARSLGLSGGAELIALAQRDCLEPGDVERFAAARELSGATAGAYLRGRFGVKVCGDRR